MIVRAFCPEWWHKASWTKCDKMLTAFFPTLYCFFFLKAFLTNPPSQVPNPSEWFSSVLSSIILNFMWEFPGLGKNRRFQYEFVMHSMHRKENLQLCPQFPLASQKTLTFLRSFRKPHQNFCSKFLCCHWLIFFCAYVIFGTTFRIIGGFQNNFLCHRLLPKSQNKLSEEGYWKDFKISKWFHRSTQKLHLILSTKRQQIIVKPSALEQKRTDLIFRTSKRILSLKPNSWTHNFVEVWA